MRKKQFKIIAVQPLKGCSAQIRKVLRENTTYFFYNDYEEYFENGRYSIRKKKDVTHIPEDFFQIEKTTPSISISAIVGKNGDGKSTVVELIIRILNNFAYATGFISNQKDLKPVNAKLNAILYYSINEEIYFIKSEGNKISHSELGEIFDITKEQKDNTKIKEIREILFYTQVTNYSLYAYNSLEFNNETQGEDTCWLNGIFHKNDGYQTPILISPWRDNGNIDVNKERKLAKERLISLFVSDKDFRKINERQKAENLMYSLEEKSKLETKTIYDFFYKVKDSSISANFESKYQIRSIPNWKKTEDIRLNTVLLSLNNVVNNIKNFVDKEGTLLERAIIINNQIINDIREELNDITWTPNDTDLKNIFDRLETMPEIQDSVQKIKQSMPNIDLLNANQFMCIVLIVCYINEWEKYLDEKYPEFQDNPYREHLIDYLAYKSISIVNEKRYPSYRNLFIVDYFLDFIEDANKTSEISTRCKEIIDKIIEDHSHVTLKIRQTIKFIEYNEQYKYLNFEDDDNKEKNESNKYNYKVSFEKYNERLKKIPEFDDSPSKIIEFLPPPIFETDVEFLQTDKEEKSYLSQLSSGERQELNTTSYVIYHLRNIDSIKDENIINYRHINLIFEEIELYFHPEYQRRYIKRLIEQIGKVKLLFIDSINICFVTHSPFILSDIPKCNVLYLDKGESIDADQFINPFGANINDILKQSFFLNNGFMGEYAQRRIKSLLDYLDLPKGNDNESEWSEERAQDFINLIGDYIIQQQLQNLYDEKYDIKNEKDREIDILKRKNEQLKKQLNEKNTDK
jgi:predicted ATPase